MNNDEMCSIFFVKMPVFIVKIDRNERPVLEWSVVQYENNDANALTTLKGPKIWEIYISVGTILNDVDGCDKLSLKAYVAPSMTGTMQTFAITFLVVEI